MAGPAQVTVTVDRARCMGTGICVEFAPGTFAHDDQAKAIVLSPSDDPTDIIASAVEACPTGALHLGPEEPEEPEGSEKREEVER